MNYFFVVLVFSKFLRVLYCVFLVVFSYLCVVNIFFVFSIFF